MVMVQVTSYNNITQEVNLQRSEYSHSRGHNVNLQVRRGSPTTTMSHRSEYVKVTDTATVSVEETVVDDSDAEEKLALANEYFIMDEPEEDFQQTELLNNPEGE